VLPELLSEATEAAS